MPSASPLPALARKAAEDPAVLDNFLLALSPQNKKTGVRERTFKALMALAGHRPGLLLGHWTELTKILARGGAFTKYPAIYLIAALVPADRERRFDRSFAASFNRLDDDAVSLAAHTARLAGPIAAARPDLEPRITRRLLALERTHFDPSRRDLVKSYALEAVDVYFARPRSRAAMLKLAQGMLLSPCPRPVRVAKAFLKKHRGSWSGMRRHDHSGRAFTPAAFGGTRWQLPPGQPSSSRTAPSHG